MICTFFGHRDASEKVVFALKEVIESLIKKGIKSFYVGNNGNYDLLVQSVLSDIKKANIDIDFKIVLSYLGEKAITDNQDKTIFPEGLENVPRRFAISKRNDWLISNANVVVVYCTNTFSNSYKLAQKATKKNLNIINLKV